MIDFICKWLPPVFAVLLIAVYIYLIFDCSGRGGALIDFVCVAVVK